MKAWNIGAALARAGVPLPTLAELGRDWGLRTIDACLLTLGYIDAIDPFAIHTRLRIERKFELWAMRQPKKS